jgi:hypothetical protein
MSWIFRRIRLMAVVGLCFAFMALAGQRMTAQRALPAAPWHFAAGPVAQAADAASAETHKQWMNDASDAQENFRFGLSDHDQKAAQEALIALESLMGKTEEYWTAKKAADGVKLSKEARGFAAQAVSQFKSGNVPAAQESFDKMGASCNACHELHLEKR